MPHYIIYCPASVASVFNALSVIGDTNTDHVGLVGFRGGKTLTELRDLIENIAEGHDYLIVKPQEIACRGDGAIESIGNGAEVQDSSG